MLYITDENVPQKFDNVEILRRIGRRGITHVFHDIDGTHSLIRDWPPVMSLTLHTVIAEGLPDGYDSPANVKRLVEIVGSKPLEETDRFCVESAGLSALTQMEWSIRRAVEEGTISPDALDMDEDARRTNSQIIKKIWRGEEVFDAIPESESFRAFLRQNTPRLFKLYEQVLNGACRDRNLQAALKHPAAWRVPGSMEFIRRLKEGEAKNYFVTGAVVDNQPGQAPMGMYEEVLAVGFEVGQGKDVEAVEGSTWDRKIPKNEVMQRICREENIDPKEVLVVGDGRSEIAAGAEMGAVCLSRLPTEAARQRQLHASLGTHLILTDYTSHRFAGMFESY
jgi:phosphoserine phosphatase